MSNYLKNNLPRLIETVEPSSISKLIQWTIDTHGGYYKRWRGGGLHRWTKWAHALPPEEGSPLTMDERLTLAFLTVRREVFRRGLGADEKADKEVMTGEYAEKAMRCGSTASVVMLHSLDEPGEPYWSSKRLSLTVGHCGSVLSGGAPLMPVTLGSCCAIDRPDRYKP